MLSAEDRLVNVVDATLYHEMGHAFIDLYELPIVSSEEDAADSLSAYIILEYYRRPRSCKRNYQRRSI